MRVRRDIEGLTVGDRDAAESGPWHPILDAYARGVEVMKAVDAAGPPTPQSWMWAANTHGIDQFTPRRAAWAQCTHASLFFLPWHRAYLAWFEQHIRDASGDDDWALPYWDYSAPGSTRRLPVEFAVERRTVDGVLVDNPLFSPARSTQAIPAASADIVEALAQPSYVLEREAGFGGTLPDQSFGTVEDRPHNYVHMAIGGVMRSPSTAGRDPVFWLHHANIDRLWEVWLSLEGSVRLTDAPDTPPELQSAWDSAAFWFGDEQRPETYAMAAVEDLASDRMDYGYESIVLADVLADAVADRRAEIIAATGGGFGVDEASKWQPVAATFDLASGEEREIPFEGGALGLDEAPPTRLLLELAGATAHDPHSAYDVEIRSTPDAAPHVVRGFSTFGLAGTPDEEVRNYLVDASSVLPDLLDEGWAGGALTVRLLPAEAWATGDGGEGGGDAADARAISVAQVTVYVQAP
ncbi:Common central domain of tyrosinase [Agromyces sp. CF514]|uniref:tyrosinase family protein n=1 Tax=Agromyces sp. CF514 TaxID=1881031 RepID=UPI0008EA2A8B|nr:tyrosinase family protein [Agromyces sp. CF514]SFR75078.1 Common central domain of tyrosinase [Agromyces sp. CF514]